MSLSRMRSFRIVLLFFVFLFLPVALLAQSGRPARQSNAETDIKWDNYTFRFLKGNQMAQVLDANGHVLGTILSMGGGLKLIPSVTGADADRLKKSFDDWIAKGGEKALNNGTAPVSGRASTAASSPSEDSSQAGTAPKSARARSDASTSSGKPPSSASTKSSAAPVRSASALGTRYGVLNQSAIDKFGNGAAIRLDLNLFRLMPDLLDDKAYMRYFIALNNCDDKSMAKTLDNELDYPDVAAFYKPKAQEILNNLTVTAGVAVYAEAGMWKKIPTLGEYDKSKGAFPIVFADHPNGAEVPSSINFDFGRSIYRNNCAIANQVLGGRSMPSSYSISLKPMSFKEVRVSEAEARRYIESSPGPQRAIVLLVDMHILDTPPKLNRNQAGIITGVLFSGSIARVRAAKPNGDTIGVLYDDGTIQ